MILQLCYASERIESEQELLQDLSDILATARKFNLQHQIHGVLYYSHGKFFQCLEGQAEVVESLFQSICQDPRHHNILRFADAMVEQSHFSQWSMKYVRRNSQIQQYFQSKGYENFQPLDLKDEEISDLLALLYETN